MASFSDNNLAMAFLPVTLFRWGTRTTAAAASWVVRTFLVCLLAKPQPVERVRVRRTTARDFKISWKPARSSCANAAAYDVELMQVDPDGEGEGATTATGEGANWHPVQEAADETTCIARDLRPDTAYRVRVRMRNSRGAGPFCEPVDVRTFRLPSLGMGSTGPLATGDGREYTWEQTLREITLRLPLPAGVASGRGLQVDYATDRVEVRNKATGELLLGGKTRNKLRPDGCVWSRDPDTGEVLIELEKSVPLTEAPFHWSCVFQGHPQIDCSRLSGGQRSGAPRDYMEQALLDGSIIRGGSTPRRRTAAGGGGSGGG